MVASPLPNIKGKDTAYMSHELKTCSKAGYGADRPAACLNVCTMVVVTNGSLEEQGITGNLTVYPSPVKVMQF